MLPAIQRLARFRSARFATTRQTSATGSRTPSSAERHDRGRALPISAAGGSAHLLSMSPTSFLTGLTGQREAAVQMLDSAPPPLYDGATQFGGDHVQKRRNPPRQSGISLYLTVWALVATSYLPAHVFSLVQHLRLQPPGPNHYWRDYYLIELVFLLAQIIGLSVLARWFYKSGPSVEVLLLPVESEPQTDQD
jgi:hypothetical protein